MAEMKYPVGVQSFSKLIEEGYGYVDKTRYIVTLVKEGGYYFLSRPRRFGKSLFLSTLHAYFEGRRDLFRGLALDSAGMDWTPSPVLHFDFNPENMMEDRGLEWRLDKLLRTYEEIYGANPLDVTPSQRLESLIRTAYDRTGRKVVILVDEYDKPLLGIEEDRDLFDKNQAILKGFFGNLKSMDYYIRFVFITGVARFNKVSIFSDLNNLEDISLDWHYADICGWTERELTANFGSGIEALAQERGETPETTLEVLRNYYDGYMFTRKGERLYNPYSVLRALKSCEIKPYWFETATPTFLARRVRKYGLSPAALDSQSCRESDLLAVGLGMSNPVPLMFQTGYLTIGSYDPRRQRYELRIPNQEVETGLYEMLLPLYAPPTGLQDGPFNLIRFQDDLYYGRPEEFMQRLAILLKDLPGEDQCEAVYRATTYLICRLCGTDPQAERHSYKGRSDIEIIMPDYIYLFEFKYNRTVGEAMDQIHDRDYAGRHALDPRPVYLIAANFTDSKADRGLTYDIQLLPK